MIRKVVFLGLALAFILLLGCGVQSIEIYISPDGNDAAAGTIAAPLKSLHRAAELVRENTRQVPVTVKLSGGVYPLTDALKLGPEDGGTTDAPVRWEAMPGEEVIISGGIRVDNWIQEEDGSWSTVLPATYRGTFRSFYVNGLRATRARYPDDGYLRVEKAGKDKRTNFYFNEGDIPKVKVRMDSN